MHTFHTPGPCRLDLRVPSGDLIVHAGDGEETHVTVSPRHGREDEQKLVEETTVQLHERDGRFELLVDVPTRRGGLGFGFVGRSPEVVVEVRCPRDSELEARTKAADVRVTGALATAFVKSVSGDLSVEEVRGDARLHTTSGDVVLDTAGGGVELNTISGDARVGRAHGPVNANLISGDLYVREAHGPLTANTVSGDQDIRAVRAGEVALHSVSGDVRVGIARGSRVWLDVKSISGDTMSELDVSDEQPSGDGPLVELRGNTVSGDFAIVRAPSIVEAAS